MPRLAVPINPAVLRWAIDESGLGDEAVADGVGVAPDDLANWLDGSSQPSQGQFTKVSKLLKRPSAVFFMPSPPVSMALPTHLRSAPGLRDHALNPAELQQIRWARRVQRTAAWIRGVDSEALPQLARYEIGRSSPTQAAAAERTSMGVAAGTQTGWADAYAAFRMWRQHLESNGVLVFQLELKRDNIRGFSASDDRAPLIAVNSAYHISNRIFTLFHELGHLVTGTESACIGWSRPGRTDPQVERWCEEFAASFLLPEADVRSYVASSSLSGFDLARRVASRYKVSTRASALRLQEMELEPRGFYELVATQLEAMDWNPTSDSGGGAGETTAEKRLRQLGHVAELVLDAENSGALSRRDVADYLNMTSGQVDDLSTLVGRAPGQQ